MHISFLLDCYMWEGDVKSRVIGVICASHMKGGYCPNLVLPCILCHVDPFFLAPYIMDLDPSDQRFVHGVGFYHFFLRWASIFLDLKLSCAIN